ncbi:hypothetical protein PUMCH_000766 [Australozyma saopauloensis]|uniref:Protein BTN n=1 Tax=Australozyma saopauloensis TaxID=291208 RepID=A0AAX4H4W4_9ASCO|nr:hypothetical protein PUMCH_000766 [[Candida] saopauloensis]
MRVIFTDPQKVFVAFLIFGLVNNVLYVVILSAAIDLVGAATPKAIVLLADIVPALTIKLASPLFIHLIPYTRRILALVALSSVGMLIISLSGANAIGTKVMGIAFASLSSGLGEVSFLQLTHYYDEKDAIGGFSMGTGAAGILGSFAFLVLTSLLGISTRTLLLVFAVVPLLFLVSFYIILPELASEIQYGALPTVDGEIVHTEAPQDLKKHILNTILRIVPLIRPYMLPLCSVYIAEYTINQGVSPTLLFPLEQMPQWLIKTYRDIYVVYGFMYQLGVFVSRSSSTFGFRCRGLYKLSVLQVANVAIAIIQSMYTIPFPGLWLLLIFALYEGLLGGLLYVNTFLSVSEEVPRSEREFSMGCVGISDSFGIMIAGCINWWLEQRLCQFQVDRGRNWCKNPNL